MNRLLYGTALAGTLLLALPAAAQNVYHTNPTPAERAQTNNLNTGAANDAAVDDDTAAPAPNANADYNAQRSDYDRKMQDYNANRARYERDRARYHDDRADYAHRWDAFYGFNRFREVSRMRSDELVGQVIYTRAGDRLGRIRDIDTAGDGRVVRVAVGMHGGRVAWIDPDDLRFDPSRRGVVTDLNRDQVDDMAHISNPRF